MHDDSCPNCPRKDREILALKADLIRAEEKRLKEKVIFQVKLASPKYKVKPGVEEDFIARVWSLGDWKEEKDGRMVLYRGGLDALSNTGHEITPEVAVRDLQPVAPHFYIESEDTAKNGDGLNPWAKNSWNMTQQGQIVLKDPAQAKRLAAAAGVALAI
jgi:hypothetical protein